MEELERSEFGFPSHFYVGRFLCPYRRQRAMNDYQCRQSARSKGKRALRCVVAPLEKKQSKRTIDATVPLGLCDEKGEEQSSVSLSPTLKCLFCPIFCTRCTCEILKMRFQALEMSKMTRKGWCARWSIGIRFCSLLPPRRKQFRLCAIENLTLSRFLSLPQTHSPRKPKKEQLPLSLSRKRERGSRGGEEGRRALVRPFRCRERASPFSLLVKRLCVFFSPFFG